MTHTPATAGPIGTGPGAAAAPVFEVRKLCDDCYEQVTGLRAECLDLCSLSLDHAGLCHPRTETDQPCDRCGETGHRLTEHQPQDAVEAADCLPLDIPAATLRGAGWPEEAVTALRIADGDATDESADDTASAGPDLHSLAYAVRRASDELGVAGPAGEAADWDAPETYHVYVVPGSPAAGAGSEVFPR